MAVAYDNTSSQALTAGDQSWNHTPTGTPAGVLVLIVEEGGTDTITGVTYSGQTMTEVAGSPVLYTTPETGSIHGFFLNNPTDKNEATVAVDTATGSDQWIGACFTVTSTTGQSEVHDTSVMAGATAQTTVGATLTITKDSFVAGAMYSGLGAPAFTEVSGTVEVVEGDLGNDSGGISRGTSIKTTDFAYTWSQASDDGMALVVAICQKEAVSATAQAAAAGTGAAQGDDAKVGATSVLATATGSALVADGIPGYRGTTVLAAGTTAAYGSTSKVAASLATAAATGTAASTWAVDQAEAAVATGEALGADATVGVTSVVGEGTAAALDATAETAAGMVNFTVEAAAAGVAVAILVNANLNASAGYAKARSA